jgi:hypothetical protein
MVPSTGFNGSGSFDMEINFSLNSTYFYVGGVLAATAANPGASEFVALYDMYKLESVEVAFMYGANTVTSGGIAVAQLPILNVVFDPTDSSVISLSSILQYQNLRTVQLGNQRTEDGYVVRCTPTPLINTLAGQTVVPTSPQWLTTDQPTLSHFGLKCYYDNAGSTLATVVGTLTMYVKYNWSFKLSH